jgi:hypothetical protein
MKLAESRKHASLLHQSNNYNGTNYVMCSTQVGALLTHIRLDWNLLSVRNTLAYNIAIIIIALQSLKYRPLVLAFKIKFMPLQLILSSCKAKNIYNKLYKTYLLVNLITSTRQFLIVISYTILLK